MRRRLRKGQDQHNVFLSGGPTVAATDHSGVPLAWHTKGCISPQQICKKLSSVMLAAVRVAVRILSVPQCSGMDDDLLPRHHVQGHYVRNLRQDCPQVDHRRNETCVFVTVIARQEVGQSNETLPSHLHYIRPGWTAHDCKCAVVACLAKAVEVIWAAGCATKAMTMTMTMSMTVLLALCCCASACHNHAAELLAASGATRLLDGP